MTLTVVHYILLTVSWIPQLGATGGIIMHDSWLLVVRLLVQIWANSGLSQTFGTALHKFKLSHNYKDASKCAGQDLHSSPGLLQLQTTSLINPHTTR